MTDEDGVKRWYLVAPCNDFTTWSVYPSLALAQVAKRALDSQGCGSGCENLHFIVDEKQDWMTRELYRTLPGAPS